MISRLAIALSLAITPAAAQAQSVRPLTSGAQAENGKASLNVTALSDSILRVRIAPRGQISEDASWAVPPDVRHKTVAVRATSDGFRTSALAVQMDPKSLAIRVTDSQGREIVSDALEPVTMSANGFTLKKWLRPGQRIFGLGDKTGPFDRRGASYVNWNTDAYGFDRGTDPIYKSIPFYIATGSEGGAYGLFLDNSWRSWFDFGHRDDVTIEMGAPGGPIDYYIIAGPTVGEVVRRYTDLTGKPPLPPRWGLGFQQSRYSYMTAGEVRELANRFRAERVPADVLWLDIDYQDRNRPFTVNRRTFPDLRGLTREIGAQGFKLVTITDLHIARAPNEGYAPYESGISGDHFLRNWDGSIYVAPVWPGPSVFPDFTRKASRDWWGGLYKGFVDDGVAGFWNDMNEPAIFETATKTMPLETTHRIDTDDFAPRIAGHAEIHNIYGMENGRATYEGLLKLRPNVRPFVMTRATFAGGQRYAVTWTGDNNATWDHLRLMVQQLINLGLSGFPWAGADVGGFTGGPSPDLLTRWQQIGAFTPVFRNHSAKNTPRVEIWLDGPKHLAIRKRFIEERYRLLPYFYAVAEQNARTGDPVMRPTFYDYPEMMKASCDQSMAFTVGRDLLVAASPKPESTHPYDICLPAAGWYDYWSGRRLDMDKTIESPTLERLPVFVRAGAILPRQPVTQSTSEIPNGPLELHVYPGPDCHGTLYWDDGISVHGPSLRQTVRCTQGKDGLMVQFDKREGTFRPWWKQVQVTIHGWNGPSRVRLNGRDVQSTSGDGAVAFTVPDQPGAADVVISRF